MAPSWSPKRGLRVGKTKRGKGTPQLAVADGNGLPLAVQTVSASPDEVRLVGETLAEVFTDEHPERLIGDWAYDSDPLDEELREQGIEMIAPSDSQETSDLNILEGNSIILLPSQNLSQELILCDQLRIYPRGRPTATDFSGSDATKRHTMARADKAKALKRRLQDLALHEVTSPHSFAL